MKYLTNFALGLLAATCNAEFLTENMRQWPVPAVQLDFSANTSEGFVPTPIEIFGEVGWHQHGTEDIVDIDIDLAIVMKASEGDLDDSITYFLMWALDMDAEIADESNFEVGVLAYKQGATAEPELWNMYQTVAANYGDTEGPFNPLATGNNDINQILSARTYVKVDDEVDTEYWTAKNWEQSNRFSSSRVVI